MPIFIRRYALRSLNHVSQNLAAVCHFDTDGEEICHHDYNKARWGDVRKKKRKPPLSTLTKLSGFRSESARSKTVRVKGRVAFRHPNARNTASGKAVRHISKPPNFSVLSKMGGLGANFAQNSASFRVAKFPTRQLCLKYEFIF